jgi:hypothetical protein
VSAGVTVAVGIGVTVSVGQVTSAGGSVPFVRVGTVYGLGTAVNLIQVDLAEGTLEDATRTVPGGGRATRSVTVEAGVASASVQLTPKDDGHSRVSGGGTSVGAGFGIFVQGKTVTLAPRPGKASGSTFNCSQPQPHNSVCNK